MLDLIDRCNINSLWYLLQLACFIIKYQELLLRVFLNTKIKRKRGYHIVAKFTFCLKDTRSLFLFFPNKAREVGRQVRHCADLKLDSAKMRDNIDVLIELLNQGCLATNQEAQSAINDLIKVRFYTVYRM